MGEAPTAPRLAPDADFAAYEPSLRAWAIRATGDVEVARDLVQETLAAALADPSRFSRQSALRTWLIGILSHKVADHFRKRYQAAFEPLDDADPPDLHSTPTTSEVERAVAARQELSRVDRAMSQLPRGERMALLMVAVEGLDREEVCRVLGVTATHLRVLLHRGRHRLRRMVEREM
jgi:RNA polymerase sigma-70 factor (ECF subfamily)